MHRHTRDSARHLSTIRPRPPLPRRPHDVVCFVYNCVFECVCYCFLDSVLFVSLTMSFIASFAVLFTMSYAVSSAVFFTVPSIVSSLVSSNAFSTCPWLCLLLCPLLCLRCCVSYSIISCVFWSLVIVFPNVFIVSCCFFCECIHWLLITFLNLICLLLRYHNVIGFCCFY